MIDIHSHILAKVDDGSNSMEMSLSMAKQYVETGIKGVIATPHFIEDSFESDISTNKLALENLKKELNKNNIPLKVYLGNEIYVTTNTIEDIESGKVASLNNSRYVLIELPMNDIPMYFEEVLYGLLLKGYIPIIAHPERNSKIINEPNLLYNYIEKGALAQLNLPSLEGMYGKTVQSCGKTLLEHKMIHFIGTDAHTNRTRSPKVNNALNKLRKIVGEDEFQKITSSNAQLLIKNQLIHINQPLKVEKKKNWFSFIRRHKHNT